MQNTFHILCISCLQFVIAVTPLISYATYGMCYLSSVNPDLGVDPLEISTKIKRTRLRDALSPLSVIVGA